MEGSIVRRDVGRSWMVLLHSGVLVLGSVALATRATYVRKIPPCQVPVRVPTFLDERQHRRLSMNPWHMAYNQLLELHDWRDESPDKSI